MLYLVYSLCNSPQCMFILINILEYSNICIFWTKNGLKAKIIYIILKIKSKFHHPHKKCGIFLCNFAFTDQILGLKPRKSGLRTVPWPYCCTRAICMSVYQQNNHAVHLKARNVWELIFKTKSQWGWCQGPGRRR